MKHKLTLALCLLLAVAAGHAAEVFTTTGADGERVYTDKPQADSQKIEVRTAAPRDQDTTQTEQPAFEELPACEQARFIVRQYENASSLAEKTDDGKTRILTAEETKERIERAREDERRLCEEGDDE